VSTYSEVVHVGLPSSFFLVEIEDNLLMYGASPRNEKIVFVFVDWGTITFEQAKEKGYIDPLSGLPIADPEEIGYKVVEIKGLQKDKPKDEE